MGKVTDVWFLISKVSPYLFQFYPQVGLLCCRGLDGLLRRTLAGTVWSAGCNGHERLASSFFDEDGPALCSVIFFIAKLLFY